jgi:hypothetical protein
MPGRLGPIDDDGPDLRRFRGVYEVGEPLDAPPDDLRSRPDELFGPEFDAEPHLAWLRRLDDPHELRSELRSGNAGEQCPFNGR